MSLLVPLIARSLRTTVVVALILLGTGVFAAFHLRREVEPRFHTNYVVVTAGLPGANAGELLATVTSPLEDLLRRTPGVVDFDSRTADGLCVCTVRLDDGHLLEVRERLRNQLAELHTALTESIVGLSGPSLDDTSSATFDLIAAIPAPGGDMGKLRAAMPALTRELLLIPSVESVQVIGLPAEQIVVEYADAELADAGFSPQLLNGLLKAQNVVAPGGYLDDKKGVATLHMDGRIGTLDELRTVGVLDPVTGRATTLDRLLEIKTEARTPPAPTVTVGGQPGVQIAVARRAGADLRGFSEQARARLDQAATGAGLGRATVLIDASDFVRREYQSFAVGLLVAELVILILLVVAMGFRAGGLVALMVPLVIFSTLALLWGVGLRINIVVLAALTIASGIIADNHIVVVQFISRRLGRGEAREDAVREAFRVLAGPLLAATLTAITGFLPVLLTHNAASEYVADLVPVIAVALGLSYVFAFVLTPFLCPAAPAASFVVRWLERGYGRGLDSALRHPVLTVAAVTLVSAGGIGLLLARPATFFPTNQSTTLAIEVLRPTGTSQSLVESDLAAVGEGIVKTLHGLGMEANAPWVALSGRDLPRLSATTVASPAVPNFGVAVVSLPSPEALAKFRANFRPGAGLPNKDVFLRVREISSGPQAPWPIRIRLSGPTDAVRKAATEAKALLATDPSLVELHQESGGDTAKWTLTLKRKEAADKSVTPTDIALAMNVTLNGLPCFELHEGDVATPVIIRAKRTDADPVDNLKDAYVYPVKGRPCVLADVADVTPFTEPASFERARGVSASTFAADCAPGANPYAVEKVAVEKLRGTLASSGVSVQSAGLAQTATEANRALLAKVPLALAAVLLVLLTQTRSIRLSLLVLAAIPCGVAGAGYGLTLAGMPMGFMPLIGLTAVAGIVVNIAIVLAASLRGRDAASAAETAENPVVSAAVDRVEPITLSALCTLGGMVPLYVFGGPLWHSMALTLAAGLIVATGFLVILIPTVYRWFGRERFSSGPRAD